MSETGGIWGVDLEIPEDAAAVFFYTAPRCEGPQSLSRIAQLTNQKQRKRYIHFLVVRDETGKPVREAFHARAVLAQGQNQPAEEVLAWVDRELALYPDNFKAHLTRWRTLLKAGQRTPETWAQVRAEQQGLIAKYPDQPEVLRLASQVANGWQDTLLQALNERFPGYEHADEVAYTKAVQRSYGSDTAGLVEGLEEFLRRFPESTYRDEVYRSYLEALARLAPERAARLADSLITHTLVLPRSQQTPNNIGGCVLPEGYAYSLRFDLYLKEGRQGEALALAERLVHSGMRDPLPYFFIGQQLAGQGDFLSAGGKICPRDPALAAQVLGAGLARATPENLLELLGFNADAAGSAPARERERQSYLERAHTQRWNFLIALAECYLAGGEYARAVPYLEESASLQEQIKIQRVAMAQPFLLLGKAHEHLGDWDQAEQAYLGVVAQDYSNQEAEVALQRLHLARYGDLEKLQHRLQEYCPQAPEFALKDSLGHQVSLADFRGRRLLLYYDSFAYIDTAQARQAIRELKGVEARMDNLGQRGVEILHVCRFPGRSQSPFRLALDDDGVADKYQANLAAVTFFLVDQEGRLRLRQVYKFGTEGEIQEQQMAAKLEELESSIPSH